MINTTGKGDVEMSKLSAGMRRLGRLMAKNQVERRAGQGKAPGAYLERGWVIANHKLVSFHAAFISSVLSLPVVAVTNQLAAEIHTKFDVLRFMFFSVETIISLCILYLSWHIGIAIHEMGHFLTAAKLTALNKDSQEKADAAMRSSVKLGWYIKMFLLIPWGKFYGVKKENGNFAPDAPYNLAVAASAPVWSGYLAAFCLPVAVVLIVLGLRSSADMFIYLGRFLLAPGFVGVLDRFLADPGKLREFRAREKMAAEQAARAAAAASKESWLAQVGDLKKRLLTTRMESVALRDGSVVSTPWQFRFFFKDAAPTEKKKTKSAIET